MANIVALVGQKGGTGKTTTTVSLATEWHRRGRKVLLVDTDPQESSLSWGQVAAEAGKNPPTIVKMRAGLHKEGQLPTMAKSYDWVLVDCPAREPEIQRSVLMIADLAIIPFAPSAIDAWALESSLSLVKAAQEIRPDLLWRVLLSLADQTKTCKVAKEALLESKVETFRSEIGRRVTFRDAFAAGLGPTTFAAKTPAAKEVQALTKEIEKLFVAARKEQSKEVESHV